MNKKVLMTFVLATLLLMTAFSLFAGNGHGPGHNQDPGNGNQNCIRTPIFNIIEGIPFEFEGVVVNCNYSENGLVISIGNETLNVTGLGPQKYWESLEVFKPVIGDHVAVKGYTVDYNGTLRNILSQITINASTIQLRDSDGLPMWQGNSHNTNNGNPDRWCLECYRFILNGTPFSYEGEIISSSLNNPAYRGDGLVIATSEGNISLSGLGPNYYWYDLGLEKPVIGDTITAKGFTIELAGESVNLLMSITLDNGTEVQLRDPENGTPIWFSNNNN